ncbi:MAG: ABC transporter ATP-binding protein [Ruminococcus sp.]|nr:ABC transporter ATP-binding protein [Ruminococcus sp.]
MKKELIVLDSITKTYATKTLTVKALDNVNLSFETGKLYAIMGHSGSGKSTLISIMGLIENFTSGKYLLNGVDVTKLDDVNLSRIRMKHIGFIFQDFYLDSYLKAYENVILPMMTNDKIKKKDRKGLALRLLDGVDLGSRVNHYPNELSGGEKQRVAIARALANNPSIILADEPTGNLDKENEALIFKELKKLTSLGKCVIVVSHSDEIKEYADVIITLDGGKIL